MTTQLSAKKTSISLIGPLEARRVAVREVTGYTDAYIYEHGLLGIESEIARASQRSQQDCPHPDRYPRTGLCRFCLAPPPQVSPGGTRGRVNRTGRSVPDETLKDAIRQMGADVSATRAAAALRIGNDRARVLISQVKAESAGEAESRRHPVPSVTFSPGT